MSDLFQISLKKDMPPQLMLSGHTAERIGKWCYDREKLYVEDNLWLLLHDGHLYYYVSAPEGYGWQRCLGDSKASHFLRGD